jgi:hypothetical protein
MHPITHLLTGWTVAETARLERRDRALVTLAAVLPDADGLGLVAELATGDSDRPLYWWSEYHHVLCHNVGFGLLLVAGAALLAVRRKTTAVLVAVAFHLHLLGDLIGSRGPDGYQWPIPYLLPFSDRWRLVWGGQWALNAWPNVLLTSVLLASTLYLAWRRGYSPVGLLSKKADAALIATLRMRFGDGTGPTGRLTDGSGR